MECDHEERVNFCVTDYLKNWIKVYVEFVLISRRWYYQSNAWDPICAGLGKLWLNGF